MSQTTKNTNNYIEQFFSHSRWERFYKSDILRILSSYISSRVYEHDAELVKQGEHPQKIIFIVEGRVAVRKKTLEGSFSNVATTPPGRTLCEQSFFDGEPASAYCHARGEVITLEMNREQYQRLCEEHPKIAIALNEALALIISQRLRNLLGKLSEISEYFGIR